LQEDFAKSAAVRVDLVVVEPFFIGDFDDFVDELGVLRGVDRISRGALIAEPNVVDTFVAAEREIEAGAFSGIEEEDFGRRIDRGFLRN